MIKHLTIIYCVLLLICSCELNQKKVSDSTAWQKVVYFFDNSHHPTDYTEKIAAPDIINILNKNYSQAEVYQDPSGFITLKLPNDNQALKQIKKLLPKYVLLQHQQCYLFTDPSVGLQIILFEEPHLRARSDFNNIIVKSVNINYTGLYVKSKRVPHSHDREIVYAATVDIKPADYNMLSTGNKHQLDYHPHVTLALFRIDKNNKCVVLNKKE